MLVSKFDTYTLRLVGLELIKRFSRLIVKIKHLCLCCIVCYSVVMVIVTHIFRWRSLI